MTDPNQKFGANLADMWLCARSYLPSIAGAFVNANKILGGTAGSSAAFSRYGLNGSMAGSVAGPVNRAWAGARDELERVTGESAENLYKISDALERVVNLYLEADAASAAEFSRETEGYKNYNSKLKSSDPDYIPIQDPSQRPKPEIPE